MKQSKKIIHFILSQNFCAAFLSLVFIISAIAKCIPISYFEMSLIQQGLVSSRETATLLAQFIIGAELALGVSILLNSYRKYISLLCILMLTLFSIHLIYQISEGSIVDCGCMGERLPTSPAYALIKNIILASLLINLFSKSENRENKHIFWLLPAVWFSIVWGTSTGASLTQSLIPLIKQPIPGINIMESEKTILVFLDVDCDHCFSMGLELSKYSKSHPNIRIGLYFLGEQEGIDHFIRDIDHPFPYKILSIEEFYSFVEEVPPLVIYVNKGKLIAKDSFLNSQPSLRHNF